jgi:hypothetical protein
MQTVGKFVQFSQLGHALDQRLVMIRAGKRRRGRLCQDLENRHYDCVWRSFRCPIGADRGKRVFHANRNHYKAPHERRSVRIMWNALVPIYVGYDCGLTVQHTPAGYARRQGKTPALPERPDSVLVNVVAEVSIAEHNANSVGARKPAGECSDERHDLVKSMRSRELLNRAD